MSDAQRLADGAIFRFWCNDDTDRGDYIGQSGDATPNAGNLKVDGKLDLVNFFPVQVDVSAFRRAWGNGASFKIRAPWSSGIWHCAVVNCLSADATDALQTEPQTVTGGAALDSADLVDLDWTGLDLGDVLRPDGTAMLAFEATRPAQADDGPELLVSLGDVEVFTYRLATKITHVDAMYRYADMRPAAESPWFTPAVPGLPPNLPDGGRDVDVFFTHGFRVSPSDAQKWGRIVFKRLWHSGFNARFHMLTWAGDYGWPDSALYYQQNAYQAQRTGGALKRYVEAAQPDASNGVFAETDDVPALLDDAVWQECDLQSDETKSVRYSPAGASAALACGSITNRPVFSVMDAAEMMNANATEDDVFLALAKYVPAVSSAVGGRAVANVRKCSDQSKCQSVKMSAQALLRFDIIAA